MNRQDFVPGFRASFEYALEHTLLGLEGLIKARTGVETDLADVARLRQMTFPQGQLTSTIRDEL